MTPLVLVLVGTDHHPFERLVRWADDWAQRHGDAVRVVVQHGSAAPPLVAHGYPLLGYADLQALVDAADTVVSHGGPATITEVRHGGRVPVVVPRDPRLGEHVDGHQQRFVRRLAEAGLVVLCEDEAALTAALDGSLADPARLRVPVPDRAGAAPAVHAVGAVVRELAERPRAGLVRRMVARLVPAPRGVPGPPVDVREGPTW